MALQKTVNKFGMDITNAYHRITDIEYNIREAKTQKMVEQENGEWIKQDVLRVDKKAKVTLKSYTSEEARNDLADPFTISQHEFQPDWESADNILKQAYAYLKTLEEFNAAVDI